MRVAMHSSGKEPDARLHKMAFTVALAVNVAWTIVVGQRFWPRNARISLSVFAFCPQQRARWQAFTDTVSLQAKRICSGNEYALQNLSSCDVVVSVV